MSVAGGIAAVGPASLAAGWRWPLACLPGLKAGLSEVGHGNENHRQRERLDELTRLRAGSGTGCYGTDYQEAWPRGCTRGSARGATLQTRLGYWMYTCAPRRLSVADVSSDDCRCQAALKMKGYGTVTEEAVQKAADLAFNDGRVGADELPARWRSAFGSDVPAGGRTHRDAGGAVRRHRRRSPLLTGTPIEVSTQFARCSDRADAAHQGHGRCSDEELVVESGKALIEFEGLPGAFACAITSAAESMREVPTREVHRFRRSSDARSSRSAEPVGGVDHQDRRRWRAPPVP